MLISSYNLYCANKQYKDSRENYSLDPSIKKRTFSQFLFAAVIFVIELVILFYAVNIAVECNKSNVAKFIHITLAVFFTLPYLIGMMLLSPCASDKISLHSKMNFGTCGMKFMGQCGM